MPLEPNPYDHPEHFDSLVVKGLRSPGQLTLSGHDRSYGWDVKQADGKSGASTTGKGEELTEFTASFYLVRDDSSGVDELAEWRAFARFLLGTLKTKPPEALDIYQADLATNEISSVTVKKVGGLVHDGKGGATTSVTFLEYRPPKAAGGSPKGSKKGPPKATIGTVDPNSPVEEPPDPNKDVKDEIDAALAEGNEKPKNPFQGVT